MWVQAFNFRLGTQDLRTADLFYQASLQGLNDSAKLPALVEKDSFMYETTRYNKTNVVQGRSMVCCVFVCSVWKAAGVFDEIDADFECEVSYSIQTRTHAYMHQLTHLTSVHVCTLSRSKRTSTCTVWRCSKATTLRLRGTTPFISRTSTQGRLISACRIAAPASLRSMSVPRTAECIVCETTVMSRRLV
jgi:hypothetical protein